MRVLRPLRPESPAFSLLLSALVTLASFATDMGLPVLAATAASLGVTPGRAALTLSVFMAGFAAGPLAVGPLSDHYGRRPLLLAGCAAFATCGALAAFATSLATLLGWRFLMGAGAGACSVLVVATVRDLFAGPEARVRQSYVNLAAGLAPVLAPSLGVAVAARGGWRAIYGALAAGGFLLLAAAAGCLAESAPSRRRAGGAPHGPPNGLPNGAPAGAPLTLRETLRRYARVLRHPVSAGYVLVVALNFAALFAYVSGSSLVLIGLLGVAPRAYAWLFACTALGLMTGAFLSAQLGRRRVAPGRVIGGGLAAIVGTALLLLGVSLAGRVEAAVLVPVAVVGFVGQGVVRPSAVQGALEPLPDIAGVASAVLSAAQMLAGALASATVAALYDGRSALALTAPMAACATAAALVYVGVVRRAERATLRAPAAPRASFLHPSPPPP